MQSSEKPVFYQTGQDEINRQHQALFAMVEQFCANPAERNNASSVTGFFASLVELTQTHFQTEEQIMAEHNYLRAGIHRVAHARLMTQIVDVRRRAQLGEDLNFDGFLEFLTTWLVEHINTEDRLLDVFLQSGQQPGCSTAVPSLKD